MNTTDIKTFNYLENGSVTFSMLDTIECSKTMKPGSYTIEWITKYPEGSLEVNILDFGEVFTPIDFICSTIGPSVNDKTMDSYFSLSSASTRSIT